MDWTNWLGGRGAGIGAVAGLVFGLLVILLGFWQTLFIFVCAGCGYWLGRQADVYGSLRRFFEAFFRRR
ncbi:MAG: DUF2273 domain-containing protein [Clostridia bacterium]|nr:MAG: DUF2273 domain-containing protein [Clostridia bacterium]